MLQKKKIPGATDLQWQRRRHIRVCQCVSACVCLCSDPNIYGSSVIIMAFEKLVFQVLTHTNCFHQCKKNKISENKASRCPSTVQTPVARILTTPALVFRLSSHLVSAAGAAEAPLETSTSSTLLLLLLLCFSASPAPRFLSQTVSFGSSPSRARTGRRPQ